MPVSRFWVLCCGCKSSGNGCKGNVCCCSVKAGKPTPVPDNREFWKDNDECDCNLICCGFQSKSTASASASMPAAAPYAAPTQQAMPAQHVPAPTGGVVTGTPVQQTGIQDPIKPGKQGYPTVQ